MAQTRSKLQRLIPIVNDTFVDTHRRPILTLVKDTSSGVHDMLFPPCDDWRYQELGIKDHASCGGNLRQELRCYIDELERERGYQNDSEGPVELTELYEKINQWKWTPEPLNLFMNVPVGSMGNGEKGALEVGRPDCEGGSYVVLSAETDCLVVMSACPNDVMDTNGGKPGDAAYEVLAPSQLKRTTKTEHDPVVELPRV